MRFLTLLYIPCVIAFKLNLSPAQVKYQELIRNKDIPIVFGIGPAGTGKTMIACYEAINNLKNRNYNKIIITRPIVSMDEELGFLPGTLNEKMSPWTSPLFDYFNDIEPSIANKLLTSKKLEIVPLAFMRGRTFNGAYIIGDEMQNSTPMQMKTLLTRIGLDSKIVITGDLIQSDLGFDNGLEHIISSIHNKYIETKEMNDDGIGIIQFDHSSIKRNPVIKNILQLY
jgi:phosphate starvation-inducible PhoH-like protein